MTDDDGMRKVAMKLFILQDGKLIELTPDDTIKLTDPDSETPVEIDLKPLREILETVIAGVTGAINRMRWGDRLN